MSASNLEALGGIGALSAATLALFGVPLQPIVWGLIGGILGAGLAKPTTRLVSICTYLSASLLSALAGHAIASQWFGGGALVANAFSASVAVFFHPALSAAVPLVTPFITWAFSLLPRRGNP